MHDGVWGKGGQKDSVRICVGRDEIGTIINAAFARWTSNLIASQWGLFITVECMEGLAIKLLYSFLKGMLVRISGTYLGHI